MIQQGDGSDGVASPLQPDEIPKEVVKAYREALAVRLRAHAPYSKYKVGAAVKSTDSQEIIVACNVENASYPASVCAEHNAINQMIARIDGAKVLEFVIVVTQGQDAAAPCGVCRQVIAEFADEKTLVYLANLSGLQEKVRFVDLLPRSYTRAQLLAGTE